VGRIFFSLTVATLLAAAAPLPTSAADVAEEILAKGIEAYQAGKLEPAIGGINAAMRGRLPAAQMARAYYYRGLAYRKQGNPGRAISDFGSALEYPGLTCRRAARRLTGKPAYPKASAWWWRLPARPAPLRLRPKRHRFKRAPSSRPVR